MQHDLNVYKNSLFIGKPVRTDESGPGKFFRRRHRPSNSPSSDTGLRMGG